MIGERENKYTDTDYGTLHMRPYVIEGNEINAFYDSSDRLVFVLDNTVNDKKPNVLLVINPSADRKWDEILSNDYDVDLETIRPKQDNKYQKLDIEYSGLNVYENLIKAYVAGDSLDGELNQLNVLRDSAARHSAMVRLTVANEVISKTNATIVKTKETIVRLNERVKSLRAKLTATKKEIGRVPTKQSASRVLKLESQIEATNEKLKRAKKRLESAQRRLEIATVDAELASELLNQPSSEIKNKKSVKGKSVPVVASKREKKTVVPEEPEFDEYENEQYDDESEDDKSDEIDEEIDMEEENNSVKPLFNDDPQILNNDIAFKPISFEAPSVPEIKNEVNVNVEMPADKDTSDNDDSENTQPESVPEIPYLKNDIFVTPEVENRSDYEDERPESLVESDDENVKKADDESLEQPDDTFMPTPVEKPMLESLAPVENVPELAPEFNSAINESEPVDKTPNTNNEDRSVLESMTPVVRQSEPVYDSKPDEIIDVDEPVRPAAIDNRLIAPMSEDYHAEIIGQETKRRPTFLYYLLLIILIALSVFTLWLYQKNVVNSTPVLTANVEKTGVLKKTGKQKKVAQPVVKNDTEIESVFLDDEKTSGQVVKDITVEESKNTNAENIEIVKESGEPVVVNAVPARVTSVGNGDETEKRIPTEEEILASKPIYEPGSKHEAMFVAENDADGDYVESTDYVSTDYVDNGYTEQNQTVQYESGYTETTTEYNTVGAGTGLSDAMYDSDDNDVGAGYNNNTYNNVDNTYDEDLYDDEVYEDNIEPQQQYSYDSNEYDDKELYYEE